MMKSGMGLPVKLQKTLNQSGSTTTVELILKAVISAGSVKMKSAALYSAIKHVFLLQNDPNYLSLVKLFNKMRGVGVASKII